MNKCYFCKGKTKIKDVDVDVRRSAIKALSSIKDPEVLLILKETLKNPFKITVDYGNAM